MDKVKQFVKYDLWVMMLDIVSVNAAYLLALVIRYYGSLNNSPNLTKFMGYFIQFAPFYTVLCLVVFFFFKLYGGMWTYAGVNDVNRIIGANVVTAGIQLVGTFLFVQRMPKSYYLIGAFLQLLFILAIRFGNRFLLIEKEKIAKRTSGALPAMVVGSGDHGRRIMRKLERETAYHVVVFVGPDNGRTIDGIPVVSIAETAFQIKNKGIRAVFVADEHLSKEDRETVMKAAKGLEVTDYTGYMANLTGAIPLATLMDYVQGPVTVVMDGEEKLYANPRDCVRDLTTQYDVKSITASRIELKRLDEEYSWEEEYKQVTGRDASFF